MLEHLQRVTITEELGISGFAGEVSKHSERLVGRIRKDKSNTDGPTEDTQAQSNNSNNHDGDGDSN